MIRMSGWLAVVLLVGTAGAARAQDTVEVEGPRAAQLREMIEARFAERLTVELGLSDEQAVKVKGVLSSWAAKRRGIERQEQRIRQALVGSMRPGVAADDRAVTRLVDDLLTSRMAYVQSFKDELVDLTPILSAVQRAQYVLLRDRLLQRVQEIRTQRGANQLLGPGRRVRPPR
jgi:hypothetical protein